MNILYLTDKAPIPTSGGIERVVYTLSSHLSLDKDINCYCGFFDGDLSSHNSEMYIKLDYANLKEELSKIIRDKNIEIIHSNVITKRIIALVFPIIRELKKTEFPSLRHYFTYHSSPGYELVKMNLSFCIKRIFFGKNKLADVKTFFVQLILHILPISFLMQQIKSKYLSMVDGVDMVICLTKSNIDRFCKCLGKKIDNITYIGNPLSFEDSEVREDTKENKVLMVCRLDEFSKRITLALKIWQMIEMDSRYDSWSFSIVGDGEDRPIYEKMVKSMELKRVRFEGRQPSLPYYKVSSIVMVTSQFEGFCLAISEAQQTNNAVVALQSDYFPALADLIDDGVTGFIGIDIFDFVNKLKRVMDDETLRNKITSKAYSSCSASFNMNKILSSWEELYYCQTIKRCPLPIIKE